MGERLSSDRMIEWISLLLVTTTCYLVVAGLRWVEHTSWVRHQLLVQFSVIMLQLVIDLSLLFLLFRSVYRWIRGRPLF